MKNLFRHKLAILACSACWVLPLPLTAQTPVTNVISHQGRVAVRENPGDPAVNFNGTGQFKFVLANGDGATLWSNDNTSTAGSEPVGAVSLPVNKGLYSVILGDNMYNIPTTVFQNNILMLRVWFSDGTGKGFQRLLPDQRLAPNGYLPSGAITAGNLADGSITNAKIAAGAVSSSKITAGTVIPGQGVSGASHTMAPNTSYNVFTETPMTLTLPSTAGVGDTVKVSGVGSGGWSVVPPSGQVLLPRWISRETSRVWTSIASSADGSKLVAVVGNGQIHTSTDSGFTWTPRESSRGWLGVASSADGIKLVAVVGIGSIHTSTDSGVTWTSRGPNSNLLWRAVASSADGTKLVAVVGGGHIHTSADSGVTWTPRATDSNRNWRSVASSADGTKLVAVEYGGQIHTSSDSGVTWSISAASPVQQWQSIASSADGNNLCAVVYNGFIYTSADAGVTWTARDYIRTWYGVASSSDGTRLAAVHSSGRIYTSSNAGITWAPSESDRDWRAVASSADGRKLAAVVQDGLIYTSDSTLSGSQGQSAILQYLGSGQWTSVGHTGSGAGLTELNAQSLVGTVPSSVLTSVPAASLTGSVPSAALTSVPAASLTGSVPSSTLTSVPAASLTGSVPPAALTSVPAASLTGSVPSSTLTSVPAANLTGSVPPASLTSVPAANLTGLISDARLSANVALRSGGNYITGNQFFDGQFVSLGNTGIGAIPETRFHVNAADSLTIMRLQSSATPGFARLELVSSQGSNAWRPGYIESTDAGSFTGGLKFVTNGTGASNKFGEVETMRLVNGKVGIGTTVPGKPLQIGDAGISNSEGMMRFASRSGTGPSSRYWDIGVPEGDQDTSGKYYSFVIDDPTSGGDPEMTIRWDSGNVGIGIASPAAKLDVNGHYLRVVGGGNEQAYIGGDGAGGDIEIGSRNAAINTVGFWNSASFQHMNVVALSFNPTSDRNAKENFETVDSREVLEKVAAMPISRWNFIGDEETPHIGPMAQDFHAAFGTGTDDKHIATVDADGVALAAIQGLNEKLEEKESVIAELRNETSALREKNEAMEARLAALEELLSRPQGNRTKANPNQAAR